MNTLLSDLHYTQTKLQECIERKTEVERVIQSMAKAYFDDGGFWNWDAFDRLAAERKEKKQAVERMQQRLDDHHLPLLEQVGEGIYLALKRQYAINRETGISPIRRSELRAYIEYTFPIPEWVLSQETVSLPPFPIKRVETKRADVLNFVAQSERPPFFTSYLAAFAPELNTLFLSEAKEIRL